MDGNVCYKAVGQQIVERTAPHPLLSHRLSARSAVHSRVLGLCHAVLADAFTSTSSTARGHPTGPGQAFWHWCGCRGKHCQQLGYACCMPTVACNSSCALDPNTQHNCMNHGVHHTKLQHPAPHSPATINCTQYPAVHTQYHHAVHRLPQYCNNSNQHASLCQPTGVSRG